MVASLARLFGPSNLQLAEEVVQEALLKALRRWPFQGVPDNPAAWLHQVARNLALDRLRRDAAFRQDEAGLRTLTQPEAISPGDVAFRDEITDDQLRLIFLCCHPDLPREMRMALTLKTAAGFSVREIARAYLSKESAIAQRLVRAHREIRRRAIPFEMPGPDDLARRLESVLEVLYLVHNEGYAAHEGDQLARTDLCEEALRMATLLASHRTTNLPVTHALASLLCFQSSRLRARVDTQGELVLLERQDRGLWDRALVARGFSHLERAASGGQVTAYHLEAGIAAEHARAGSEEQTDWTAILELYDELIEITASPVAALNRAVALWRVSGPRAGLAAVDAIRNHPALTRYHLLHAVRGELLERMGNRAEAAGCYRFALSCPCSAPERRFLEGKLAVCLRGETG